MKGLIIKPKYADLILAGEKTWELRSRSTNIRGEIALIKSGTGLIYAVCDLVDVQGPFTASDLTGQEGKTGMEDIASVLNSLNYEQVYAWVLENIRVLKNPKPYDHPHGAITWVSLPEHYLARKPKTLISAA